MFTILNRLRGTRGYFSKVISVVILLSVYFLFRDIYVAVASGLGYLLGESFGWGNWVGNLTSIRSNEQPPNDDEGRNNGIQFISKFLVPDYKTNYMLYSRVALSIRGIYWWLPTLLPLYFVGIDIYVLLIAIVGLSILFPVACEIGHITSNYWRFRYMNGPWEHQEVWYGLFQDIVIFSLLIYSGALL